LVSGAIPRVERVDHAERDRELLSRDLGDLQARQPAAPVGCEELQVRASGQPVVVEHRPDPLLPLAAIIDQRMPQPDPCAEIDPTLEPGQELPHLRDPTAPPDRATPLPSRYRSTPR